jgi:NADH:ubiquinone oxidoreductase subunit 6 (subunit J)
MDDVQKEQALSAIRTLLAIAAGFLVGHGYVNEVMATELVGAIMALVPIVWGFINKQNAEKKTQLRVEQAYNAGATATLTANKFVAGQGVSNGHQG